jgi:hypothetical protein
MCIFSRTVDSVNDTRIFGRGVGEAQILVYDMAYAAETELSMVLPLPVPPGSAEHAVRFIDLSDYPHFFDDMDRGFETESEEEEPLELMDLGSKANTLKVHDVGDFEASFVPRISDFARLDERFRVPDEVWARLSMYRDYGFTAFKLKATRSIQKRDRWAELFGMNGHTSSESIPQRPHPMAFQFPRRNSTLLFFPTVHVHAGVVERFAQFDHKLYCQTDATSATRPTGWQKSHVPSGAFMHPVLGKEAIDLTLPCWRFSLVGNYENMDCQVGAGGAMPRRQLPGETSGAT